MVPSLSWQPCHVSDVYELLAVPPKTDFPHLSSQAVYPKIIKLSKREVGESPKNGSNFSRTAFLLH